MASGTRVRRFRSDGYDQRTVSFKRLFEPTSSRIHRISSVAFDTAYHRCVSDVYNCVYKQSVHCQPINAQRYVVRREVRRSGFNSPLIRSSNGARFWFSRERCLARNTRGAEICDCMHREPLKNQSNDQHITLVSCRLTGESSFHAMQFSSPINEINYRLQSTTECSRHESDALNGRGRSEKVALGEGSVAHNTLRSRVEILSPSQHSNNRCLWSCLVGVGRQRTAFSEPFPMEVLRAAAPQLSEMLRTIRFRTFAFDRPYRAIRSTN
jgi:hypothetical protein